MTICSLAAAALAGECARVDGDKIHIADLARVRHEFAGLDPDIVIGYAPVPGAQRIFSAGQLLRLMERHGGGQGDIPDHPAEIQPVCFERTTTPLSKAAILTALRRAIGDATVRIEVLDYSRQPTPPGELEFELENFHPPAGATPNTAIMWRGRVVYGERRSFPVWVRLRAAIERTQVVARRDLKAGEEIGGPDVALRTVEAIPTAKESLAAVEEAAGARLKRMIAAGEPIHPDDLIRPPAVERGQRVHVVVESGAARLQFESRAEASGRTGEIIPIASPLNGKRFRGTVSGERRVVVQAGEVEP